MGLWQSTKNVASKLVDIRVDKWMSLDYIKEATGRTGYILRGLVIPQQAKRKETFEEALARLHLSEADIAHRKKEFTRLFYTFLIIALLIIGYAVYMIAQGFAMVGLVSFCLSLYALSQAFRFHFWLFQIKNRKLGCTLKEWFNNKIDNNKTSDKTKTEHL